MPAAEQSLGAAAAASTAARSKAAPDQGQQQQQQEEEDDNDNIASPDRVALLAVGTKGGCCQLWRYSFPKRYGAAADSLAESSPLQYLGAVRTAAGAYVTSITWAVLPAAAAAATTAGSTDEVAASAALPHCGARLAAGDELLLIAGTLTALGNILLATALLLHSQ
jgi:hypothetical protein